eukprot:391013_1
MGATCEPCETDYHENQPSRFILMSLRSTSAVGERTLSGSYKHAKNEETSTTSTCTSNALFQSKTSLSLISTVCASMEAPELIQSNANNSVSMSDGDYAAAALDALEFQRDTLRLTAQRLFPLKGWLEKKQCAPPYSWQKRYVVVQDGYLLWSSREMTITNGITQREKIRWNKCVSLKRITSVTQSQSKKQRKFRLSMKNDRGCRLWKASCKKERDDWMDQLNA